MVNKSLLVRLIKEVVYLRQFKHRVEGMNDDYEYDLEDELLDLLEE